MHPDLAASRRGHWKGCACYGCRRSLKKVHIPCCVSITMVTCLRQTEQARGEKRRTDAATRSFWTTTTTHDKEEEKCLAEADCHSGLVRETGSPQTSLHLLLILCDATVDGAAGLYHYRHKSLIVLVFFFPSISVDSGFLKPKWNWELTDISSVKVLSERP